MTKATRDEYDRTVQLAEAAIKGHKKLALKLKKPSAEALMAAVQEKAARGEAATVAEIGAWASATATQNTPKRGRGRPTVDMAARGAFGAAYLATVGSGLTNYRNSASGHRMTRCDALVEAMQAAGYTSLTTYDAAAAESRSWRRIVKRMAEVADMTEVTSLATCDAATVGLGTRRRSVKSTTEIMTRCDALTEVMNAAKFTSLTTYFTSPTTDDTAAVGLKSWQRKLTYSCNSGHHMARCDAWAEAKNAAILTSLVTYDAAAAELGSIWRSFECTTEAANAARRSEDSLSRRGKLAGRIRGTMTIQLSPKTIDKPKRAAKTKR